MRSGTLNAAREVWHIIETRVLVARVSIVYKLPEPINSNYLRYCDDVIFITLVRPPPAKANTRKIIM